MSYKEIRDQTRKKKLSPEKKASIASKCEALDDIEELVKKKYNGIKNLYDDLNDPENIIPNRDEIRKSLNNLLLVEEKVKYNEMVQEYETKTEEYKLIIESLIKVIEILLDINS